MKRRRSARLYRADPAPCTHAARSLDWLKTEDRSFAPFHCSSLLGTPLGFISAMLFVKLLVISLAGGVLGQLPPTPEGVTVLKSKFHENVTISFKKPGICETTPGVKSYAGYVHLPPGSLNDAFGEAQDYPINTFFWFFEARKNTATAPLAIWLNGGPGGSSLIGLLQENGPCSIANDSKTTYINPWSWNNEVNMLYIDQPNQVGLSYDTPTNVTLELWEDAPFFEATPADFSKGIPKSNNTFRVGTVSSQNSTHTANTTAHAAHALWHFAQTWFTEFPHYKPEDDRISLWAESYGGHYGPGFMRFFQEQNDKIDKGTSDEKGAHRLHLDTLGIVNGVIDYTLQAMWGLEFGYNNTYGIQLFNETIYNKTLHQWYRPSGCLDRIQACRAALKSHPQPYQLLLDTAENSTSPCTNSSLECEYLMFDALLDAGRGAYDIAAPDADPFPPPHMHGYMTDSDVLSALGVPVNFTLASIPVGTAFDAAYDLLLGDFLQDMADLLDDGGVKVHMMYGDRDFGCNWMGGEAASLAVPWSRKKEFEEAGYAPLLVDMVGDDGSGSKPGVEVKGLTRQVGNFSFTRVFQAGHEVPAYQPQAAYEIFMRATFNKDIPTGLVEVSEGLKTVGFSDARVVRHAPPPMTEPRCYVLGPMSCTPEAWETVVNGTAVVKDYFVVGVEKNKGMEEKGFWKDL
ncbi:putative lysosomal protective protein precursor [Cercophora newfieldiana]|uniref:Carboxypeptidase n=1 Tax=Cercophora newfieldiana TaxID=92897 RepID=A0AA40CQW5_9PEZI|nr:putative lysosomal protective protein precursor [Cercophora newfieldiana]